LLKRLAIDLKPDIKRVVCFPYYHSIEKEKKKTIERIYNGIKSMDQVLIQETHNMVITEFSARHKTFFKIIDNTYKHIKKYLPQEADQLSAMQQELLASYFLKEYSVEAAALFNPSMVVHPVQDSNEKLKILISLRATGEQHISSIEFFEGYIKQDNEIELLQRGRHCRLPELKVADIEKSVLVFENDVLLNEQVIFPMTTDESNGIEDVRFVKFTDDQGKHSYYGTFTAYDGRIIKSKLICTEDFKRFTVRSLKGRGINDKGMALFPRKIDNKYVMISRQDGENIRIMYSDDILTWQSSQIIQVPELPWQLAKLGNCGSPIEINDGWLLLVHGVGPVRKYVIGAYLLDKKDPTKILKRTKKPMLQAQDDEREGYVPNVVYSCGGICHNDTVFIPFALSDYASSVVSIAVNDILNMME